MRESPQSEGTSFTRRLGDKPTELMEVEDLDHVTSRMTKRLAVLRVSTKNINLWTRQLEMKRREAIQLAGLMGFDEVKKEIGNENSLESWARRCSCHFKKERRMLFEVIVNITWVQCQKEITHWCREKMVCDHITDQEIEEIRKLETPDQEEAIRLNG